MLPGNYEIREMLRRQAEKSQVSHQMFRLERAGSFEEIAGLAIALITLAWIFACFAGLAGFGPGHAAHEAMTHVHNLAHYLPPHVAMVLSRAGTVAGFARRGWKLLFAKDCA